MEQRFSKKLRVLCLHGFNSDAVTMEYTSTYFRDLLNDQIEFHFINSTHLADNVAPP